MKPLKNLPIGLQNFAALRRDNYFYVDKTAYVYKLTHTNKYYFLSRPRRFGKSMLVSTLHAYFEGRRELFEGLAIETLETDWAVHPVFHIDLNIIRKGDETGLDALLEYYLCEWEKVYGADENEKTPGIRFMGLIKRACRQTGQQVVILVDEYDKPILEELDNEELQAKRRATLKEFYGTLKTLDEYIRFAFLTGVTKFGKVGVFSGINNLRDISMSAEYVGMCGVTDDELDTVFAPYVDRLADSLGMTAAEAREELRTMYDGYHFCENSAGIYNPFSLVNTFESNKFKNYWFETGTPSYLLYLLKKNDYNLEEMATAEVDEDVLNSAEAQSTNPLPVIYQSGYLTIKGYDSEFRSYTLGFPNKEVERGFMNFLLPHYSSIGPSDSNFFIINFVKEVRAGKVDAFLKRLSSLFADTPYELIKDLENHYQNVFFIVTKLMGFYVKAEYHTSQGRIDLVLQTADYTYVMEFKLDGTAEEALAQIADKHYALPFENGDRKLIKIGINFSSATRNIDRWLTT
jgi:hypothetical protein